MDAAGCPHRRSCDCIGHKFGRIKCRPGGKQCGRTFVDQSCSFRSGAAEFVDCDKIPGYPGIVKAKVITVSGGRPALVRILLRVLPSAAEEDDDDSDDESALSRPVQLPDGTPFDVAPAGAGALGTVCINLQQTPEDGKMTLRLFGKSDDVLKELVKELGYSSEVVSSKVVWPVASRALVPYDANGKRVPDGGEKMWLDLSDGQAVRITPGHNIQGARQPQFMHIGAKKPYKDKAPGEGLGKVMNRDESTCSFTLSIEGAVMKLGLWWLDAAIRGGVDVLPIVNSRPTFQ